MKELSQDALNLNINYDQLSYDDLLLKLKIVNNLLALYQKQDRHADVMTWRLEMNKITSALMTKRNEAN